MKRKIGCAVILGLIAGVAARPQAAQKAATVLGATELRVDGLAMPLGIDDPAPRFSWQLRSSSQGARQSGYDVQVASQPALLREGKADIWSSGRIDTGQSMNIPYAGPKLAASTRYYWEVRLWDATGHPYPAGPISWWETGLLTQSAWHAGWIGYETPEEAEARHAKAAWITNSSASTPAQQSSGEVQIAYRSTLTLDKPVRFAALYATAQDTVSAWINGAPVLTAAPFPAWKQLPWKKFVRAEVSARLHSGANTLAFESVHYVRGQDHSPPPLMATLVVEYQDGSWASFSSQPTWKTAVQPADGWQKPGFDDSAWKTAIAAQAGDGDVLGRPWVPDSVKALRDTFTVRAPVVSARLYATALGAYELFLNGTRVGDDVMDPGWTDYRERVKYQTFDVTAQLAPGANAIGALLAPGWYESPFEWFQQPNNYGDTPPALRAELRIQYADGGVDWVTTNAGWQAHRSRILHSEIYDGETQDARLAQPGWNTANFNARGWHSVLPIEPKPMKIEAQDFPPIRVERPLSAVALTEPEPGVYIYDFGQNLAGVERVRVSGRAGTDVRLRFGEVLNPDGTLYTANMRTAKATDHFILAGNGVETFTPQFTYHGFRYAELTGLPARPGKDAVTAVVFHTAAPFTAHLVTGSPLVNQLWSNIQWGQRSNFMSVPTDCPQRDERLGWMADAQVFWRAASYNMDLTAFSRKYAEDMRGTQAGTPFYGVFAPGILTEQSGSGAGWSDAGVIVTWTSWLQTGSTRIIDENWSAMEAYLDAIAKVNPDGLWRHDSGIAFGDWLAPEGPTNQTLIATAYWAYDVNLMREMAHATGRTRAEQRYAALLEKIRSAFEKQFVGPNGSVAGAPRAGAKKNGGETQTGYVLALHMDLLPRNLRAAAAQRLVNLIHANHDLLGTGFLGTPYLLEELTKAGHAHLAYTLLLSTRYPSWGYMIQQGATTMWERWNGNQMLDDPSMNSFNHYAYGAVADWIYRYAAGVDTSALDPGFRTVVLHPAFDARLGRLAFDYQSAYGLIHSDWSAQGNSFKWDVTLPANTTGWLALNPSQAAKYKLEGVPLLASKLAKAEVRDGENGFAIPAGQYTLEVVP